jgi:hypothetical protein
MPQHQLFNDLSDANQARASAMFCDAKPFDGYLYELDINGTVVCRARGPFEPASRTSQPNQADRHPNTGTAPTPPQTHTSP